MLSPVDEIKNKLDIVEVISGYIKLTKAGRNFRANCPFHSEKTPSFMVSSERQIWHCFGCGKGGDIFGFVKEIEGLEFPDTLRLLAQRAGVTLKKQDSKLKSEKQRLLEICDLSAKFFSKQISASSGGAKIIKYLQSRGINDESISQWRLGFAPDDWHALSDFLKSRGYTDEEIIASGVVVEKEAGSGSRGRQNYYDRFRNRIIFPIFDINGQAVGFAGRAAPGEKEDTAKYINTPQTLIYDKGHLLYGLNFAKTDIRKQDFVVLVEGNIDVILSHQHNFKNTVASSGTALTIDHLKIIKRYTNNLVLAFDKDTAGYTATTRADSAFSAFEFGSNVKIISIPAKKDEKIDPADILKTDSKKWQKMIDTAVSLVKFYIDNAFAKFNPHTIDGKKEIARVILPVLKRIPDKIEQSHWIQELATKLKTRENVIIDALKSISETKDFKTRKLSAPEAVSKIKNRLSNLEEEIIGLMLLSPDLEIANEIKKADIEFINPQLNAIFSDFTKYFSKSSSKTDKGLKKWRVALPEELNLLIEQILFKLEIQHADIDNFSKHLHNCLKEFKKEKVWRQMTVLRLEIKECEKKKDKKELASHLEKFKQLASQLNE